MMGSLLGSGGGTAAKSAAANNAPATFTPPAAPAPIPVASKAAVPVPLNPPAVASASGTSGKSSTAASSAASGGEGLFKWGSFAARLAVGMASSLKDDAEKMMKSIEAEQEAKVRKWGG